jgi:hypothetical protein
LDCSSTYHSINLKNKKETNKMKIIKMKTKSLATLLALLGAIGMGNAGTVTIVGNGAGGGPIFVTSTGASIAMNTRVYVGTFSNESLLTSTVSNYLAGSANYAATVAALQSNFVNIGTGVTNYGAVVQSAVGGAAYTTSTTELRFNSINSLAINGAAAANYNTFNGSITVVIFSLSIGTAKNLYIWTAADSGIAIVRNANGSGTAAWVTPSADATGVTMNLSGLQATAGGSVEAAEVLLGTVSDYATGNDLIALRVIPEPSSVSLLALGVAGLVALRARRKS